MTDEQYTCPFKRGDKVLVKDRDNEPWKPSIFVEYHPDWDEPFECVYFIDDMKYPDRSITWSYCRDFDIEIMYKTHSK